MDVLLYEWLNVLRSYLEAARSSVNSRCVGKEPWQLIIGTFGVTLLVIWITDFIFQPDDSAWNRAKKGFFRVIRCIPIVRRKVQEQITSTNQQLEESFSDAVGGATYVQALPTDGFSQKNVMKEIDRYKEFGDVKWNKGKCSGTVYSGDDDLTELMTKVHGEFAWSNPLHPDVFPGVRKMEAEVVRMTCTMFNGGPESCGSMTSGGTESIVLACKAYRDRALDRGIKYPQMVIPVTAHCAFDKAAAYLRMRVAHVAVDAQTRKVDLIAMKKAITKNTCMLVGSTPHFPHGIMDSIVDIAKLGVQCSVPVHVDACLGGFLIAFMKAADFPLPPFDFSVDGVTSISADTHKYGFAPKGSSVVMYSHKNYRKYQYFVQPDWPGGIYASPTFAGSRSGAIIAACWATMMYMGEQGYIDATRRIIQTARHIHQGLRAVKHIFVYGEPQVSVIAVGSSEFNVYRLSDAMTARGWNLNILQFPSSLHFCVTLVHTKPGVADQFVSDMTESVAEIMKDPTAKCGGQAAIYGLAQSLPDRSIVADIATCFFDAYYSTETRPSAHS